jgi:7,8-dihydroneopterin aldolase/epimerase/oxygenase
MLARGSIVFISDLAVETVIGVYAHERKRPLSLLMDLEIEPWDTGAGETDRIKDTVDYGAVVSAIRSCLATARYELLERLAEVVAVLVLDNFGARWVSVKIAKTGVIAGVGQVGVRIERTSNSREPNQTAQQ